MENTRLMGLKLAAGWVILLIALFCWSGRVEGLVVYALLAALVGLRRSVLTSARRDRSVAAALAYGAGLSFGPVGGAIAGAFGSLAWNTGTNAMPNGRTRASLAFGAVAGCTSGLAYSYTAGQEIIVPVVGILLSAFACLISVLIVELIERRQLIYCSFRRRLSAAWPLTIELATGIVLSGVVYSLWLFHSLESVLLLIPVSYLVRQSVSDIISNVSRRSARSCLDGQSLCLDVIRSLVAAIDARDRFDRSHAGYVSELALKIAEKLDISDAEVEDLRTAALLHDIGKLRIPEHILLKPGRLDSDQLDMVRHHPEMGQRILEEANLPVSVRKMTRSHHERWDGTGYPDGLAGDQIPLGARILCLADVYDAMTSRRSYRAGKTADEAVQYISSASGTHFDPTVVRAFLEVVERGELPEAADDRPLRRGDAHPPRMVAPIPADNVARTGIEFAAMYEMACAAGSTLDLDELLQLTATKIREMISCSACAIFLGDGESNQLSVRVAQGTNALCLESESISISHRDEPGDGSAEYGTGMIASSTRQSPEGWVDLPCALVVPLIWEGATIGAVKLYHNKVDGFSNDDLCLLSAVAPQVSMAVHNALLFRQISQSAMSDALTGLHNARYLFVRIEQELSRAKRLNRHLSVLVLDLDNFKSVNDTFGHQYGDMVLRDIASLLLSQVRDYDLVCRYAGDEFVIVLPSTGRAEALETARRMESAADTAEPYCRGDKEVKVGLSIGVATYPNDGEDARALIARADVNMYAQKRRRKARTAT